MSTVGHGVFVLLCALKALEGRREATCSEAIDVHSGGHSGHSRLVFLSAESFFISDLTNKKRNLWSISYSANKYAEMSLVLAEKSHARMHHPPTLYQTPSCFILIPKDLLMSSSFPTFPWESQSLASQNVAVFSAEPKTWVGPVCKCLSTQDVPQMTRGDPRCSEGDDAASCAPALIRRELCFPHPVTCKMETASGR